MALPFDYIFDPDAIGQNPEIYRLSQVQVRFLLTVLMAYSDVSSLNWVDSLGNKVTLNDTQTKRINGVWSRLQIVPWT